MGTENPDGPLVWVDLEMSGLEPEAHTILEIATLITDAQLTVLAEGPLIAIAHPAATLEAMDAWNKEHHAASGLTVRVLASTVSLAAAEERTLEFVRRYCPERQSPLCGNSIHHDRRFIARYMPRFDRYLHYRNVDVSTVKELVRRWYPQGPTVPEKKHAHLALDDIRESIAELRFYREHFFRS